MVGEGVGVAAQPRGHAGRARGVPGDAAVRAWSRPATAPQMRCLAVGATRVSNHVETGDATEHHESL